MAIRLSTAIILALVPEDLVKYSGPDLVVTEGKVPLEVYNICCGDMLVCYRDGGTREYVKISGPAVSLVPTSLGISSVGSYMAYRYAHASVTFLAQSHKRKRASRMGCN